VTAAAIVKERRMSSQHREPRLEEMLADSIIKAVMKADGVDPRELEAELKRTAALLRAARRRPIRPTSVWTIAEKGVIK
jgi:DNA-binding protein H-NS